MHRHSTLIKMVQNGEANIAYTVVGSTETNAPTVCLIASTGRGPDDFSHLAKVLGSGGLRVILPWPRGAGASTGPTETLDFHDLASDAAAVIAAEATEGAVIVAGHAYGCWIARTVAQDRPDLVDGLILLAAGAGKWPEELSQSIDVAMSSEAREEDRIAALQRGFFAPGHCPRHWLKGWYPHLISAQRAARGRTDRASWWQSGTAPILDIVGLQDPFRPEAERTFYLKEFAPRVVLTTVDGASHALPDEKPDEVGVHMLGWIRSLPPREAPK